MAAGGGLGRAARLPTGSRLATIDQSDLPANFTSAGARFGVAWSLTSLDPAAQTFVAGRTGSLVRVLLPLLACNGVDAGTGNPNVMKPGVCQADVPQVDVKITALTGGGIEGHVIADATNVTPPVAQGASSATAAAISFTPGAPVVRGKAYAIVVTPLADWPPASYQWSAFKTDAYRRGSALWEYQRSGWVPVRSAPFTKTGPFDFGFATYVASP